MGEVMGENIEFYIHQISLARTEIKNLRQRITSLKHEHSKEVKDIKATLNRLRCVNCAAKASTLVSNNSIEQPSSSETNLISYKPIGYIESTFKNKRGVPRQPSVVSESKGAVVIDPYIFNNPEHALSGLQEFSHMWIIFHFHMTQSNNTPAKVSPPRLAGERCGVFSTRSPHRPCPIGLSLVKILSIEGNKITFNGVDMVNGTPVLDIKPFIPQYDYPVPSYGDTALSLRPQTEGISDTTEKLSNVYIGDDYTSRSPYLSNPMRVDGENLLLDSPSDDEIPSPGNNGNNITAASPSPESPSSLELPDIPNISPVERLEYERGAPDGQERFTPPQSGLMLNISRDNIYVAPWINNPPAQRYNVVFTDDTLNRLESLIGDRAQDFKNNIENLLAEDPRSQYVRTRYPDHEYSCVLEDLSLSCVFDASNSVCTIVAVRTAEDLQN